MIAFVKRPFKSNGIFYGVGSLIKDPSSIRYYKSKVFDGIIVELTKDTPKHTIRNLEAKYGVDLQNLFVESKPKAVSEAKPVKAAKAAKVVAK